MSVPYDFAEGMLGKPVADATAFRRLEAGLHLVWKGQAVARFERPAITLLAPDVSVQAIRTRYARFTGAQVRSVGWAWTVEQGKGEHVLYRPGLTLGYDGMVHPSERRWKLGPLARLVEQWRNKLYDYTDRYKGRALDPQQAFHLDGPGDCAVCRQRPDPAHVLAHVRHVECPPALLFEALRHPVTGEGSEEFYQALLKRAEPWEIAEPLLRYLYRQVPYWVKEGLCERT